MLKVRVILRLGLFTVMIFAAGIILILSLLLSSHYEFVLGNTAFVLLTILMRFSRAVQKTYDVGLGLLLSASETLILFICSYHLFVSLVGATRATTQGPSG